MATRSYDSVTAINVAQQSAGHVVDGMVSTDPDDGDHLVPGELRRFMAQLRLLQQVPFAYLVPDAELLPPESIRFFYVDRDWTDALVQGVLSVGTITTADRTQLEAVYPHLRSELDETERAIRRPANEERLSGAASTITGFLLRSRAVSGWPGLHVRAYSRDVLDDDALTTTAEASPDRLKLLRVERLAPAILLVLIDGVPEVMHIEEPRQGIQFGARIDPDGPVTQRKVRVRDALTGDLIPPVDDFTSDNSVQVPFRPNAPGVINLTELKRRMEAKTNINLGTDVDPHEFALQMLRFPFRQVFGDPDDTEALQFYDLDEFKVTTSFKAWDQELKLAIDSFVPLPPAHSDTDGGQRP